MPKNLKIITALGLLSYFSIFFSFSFVSPQYAIPPPCAGLGFDYSQCLPPTATAPGNNWSIIDSAACSQAGGTCWARSDSCPVKYVSRHGACNQSIGCAVGTADSLDSDHGGCDNSNLTGHCCIDVSAPTANPSNAPTDSPFPTGTVKNPCPNDLCDTAIGSINVKNGGTFISKVFQVLLGLSGGIALLIIIFSGYTMVISQGNPEKTKGAQETLTAAIVGLLFIILSLVILQIIGIDILGLPGFSK